MLMRWFMIRLRLRQCPYLHAYDCAYYYDTVTIIMCDNMVLHQLLRIYGAFNYNNANISIHMIITLPILVHI